MNQAEAYNPSFNRLFSHVQYNYAYVFEYSKLHNPSKEEEVGIILMHCSLFKFTLILNSVLSFWKRWPSSSCSVYQKFSHAQCLLFM
jgi:hypothetical protein